MSGSPYRLDGKVALVTGASRGIGRGIAMELARLGAVVLAAARDPSAAEATAEEARALGGASHAVGLDVTSDDSVERVVRTASAAHGPIAILVNNAGITRDGLLLRLKPEDWDAVLDTNLNGVYRTCRAVAPGMVRARWGRIVNVTSVVGSSGNAGQTNYAASKAAIEGFSRSLARELASRNVTVNCVAPGFIDTDMTRVLGDEARAKLLDGVPLRRLGTVEDIACAVAFLSSDAASYITGSILHVNGGMYM